MSYIENFLGLGTVILNSNIPKGTIYGTAKENLVLYYIPVNGADLGEVFQFTSDELGYIGIHETSDYDNMTAKDTVVSGIVLFAERIDGIVVGTIGGSITPTITTDVDTITIPVGGLDTIHAKVAPAGTAYTWASADDTVVTVSAGLSNADVVISGVATGTANVTCTAGGVTKTVAVTVSASA